MIPLKIGAEITPFNSTIWDEFGEQHQHQSTKAPKHITTDLNIFRLILYNVYDIHIALDAIQI